MREARPLPRDQIGVIVVARYPALRAGLRAIAERSDDVVVLADGTDDDLDTPLVPDALLVDVDPEDHNLPARLAERYPDAARVLLLDVPATARRIAQPERATALLLKDADPDEIGAALHAAVQGLVVLAPEIAREQAASTVPYPRADETDEILTDREHQVLELLALGLPNKTIAMELGISEHTAKFHVAAIMSKLHAASRTEAVAVAARRGLLVL